MVLWHHGWCKVRARHAEHWNMLLWSLGLMRHVLRGVVVVDLEVEVLGEDLQLVRLVRQVGPGLLEVVLEMVELPDHIFEALGSRGSNLENTLVGVHKGCNVLEHRAN